MMVNRRSWPWGEKSGFGRRICLSAHMISFLPGGKTPGCVRPKLIMVYVDWAMDRNEGKS